MDIEISEKQELFLNATADEVLFGGAAGGGKSYGQIIDALLYALKYPKSKQLMMEIVKLSDCKDSDIVLDFFSGSATTAHAVMQLNAEDGGNRKFIMVQIPEETDEKSEAYKAGYKNICEIGKERIRRASKKIHEDKPDAVFDDGFKVYKINQK